MSQYIPFSGTTNSFVAKLAQVKSNIEVESENLLRQVTSNAISLPTKLSELDRENVAFVDLSVDAALSLNIPFGAADNKVSRRIFIQEYKKYKEIVQGDEVLHAGVSIRWVVNIKKLNASANTTSLPMITASAQFNNLAASVNFEVVGLSSQAITELLPSNVDLKSDTYVDLANAFEAIKKLVWNEKTAVLPTVLGIFGKVKDEEDKMYADSVAMTYALDKIKRGRTLNQALSNIAAKPDSTKEVVRSVYEEIVKSSELNAEPSPAAREKAGQLLDGLL